MASRATQLPVDAVREIAALVGDDDEDTALLREMKQDAIDHLAQQAWCRRITEIYWGDGIGGVVAVFLFVFEADAADGSLAAPAWCVVGDLPSLLLPCTGRQDTPVDVLERYCQEMERWVASVRAGEGGGGCVPVAAAPTLQHAEMLDGRIQLLREDIIPQLRLPR